MLFKSKHQETRFMRIPSLVINTWGWDFSSAWLAPRNPAAGSCSLSNHFKPRISVDRNGRNWLTWTKKCASRARNTHVFLKTGPVKFTNEERHGKTCEV
jgi:hypothetical protein